MSYQREVALPMRDDRGVVCAQLRLRDRAQESIQILDDEEAAEYGEEPVQLLEGRPYDYALLQNPAKTSLEETLTVQPNRLTPGSGRLDPGLATGLLSIHLVDEDMRPVATASVEVRTNKLHYRTQYRHMLDDIAEVSMALLMDIRGASEARLQTAAGDPETLHQQFVIIRALLEQRELHDSVARILGTPHRRWITSSAEVDPRRALRPSSSILRQIAVRPERIPLPSGHPIAAALERIGVHSPSLPSRFSILEHVDEVDTPENRFIKFALEDWEAFLLLIERRVTTSRSPADQRLARESRALRKTVSTWLSDPLFLEIGRLRLLPLSSPVLQKRGGYREVLRAWTTFRLATSLAWDGGRDVFGGGKRDVAVLYEYWVFFQLLALVGRTFELDTPPGTTLIETTPDGLDLRLKAGRHLSFRGRYLRGGRPLGVRFSYNRTFSSTIGDTSYPLGAAWTRPMRPDYTLSLWPIDFDETEAERQEMMVHVHFDAKYRVEELVGLFGQEPIDPADVSGELDAEQEAFRTGTNPKRADLLKMHAYRDAIRRSGGAYVIFPGSDANQIREWRAFTELLPGLGAFAVRPGAEETSLDLLRTFIQDVADFAGDDSRRLEQQTYHIFRIQEPSGAYRARMDLPRHDGRNRKLRRRPTSES